jgi:hypothetical protein
MKACRKNSFPPLNWLAVPIILAALPAALAASGGLDPADTVPGYISRLLINETPFPGERGWVSTEDTEAAMLSILWVLDSRIHHIPPGYRQKQIASVHTDNIIDVITAGGEKGQCDGFYRDSRGRFVAVPRVEKRINSLRKIAGQGKPGRFADLLNYASGLARAYVKGGIREADRFVKLSRIGSTPVTGRAYSWMANRDYYQPGGNFIKIPDRDKGALGGNRFFTLKKL